MQQRWRLVVGGLSLGLCMQALACSKDDPAPAGSVSDAGYDLPPGRTVVEDVPDGFFNPRDLAGEVPPATTGSPPVGGDAGPTSNDGPEVGDGPVLQDGARAEVRPGDAAGGCDIVRQSCPVGDGCYPGGNGLGACKVAGGNAENIFCLEHQDCLPGFLCAEGSVGGQTVCLRVCDPRAATTCPGARGCRAFQSAAWGTCAP